jgi:hypothetical protein
LLLVIEFMDVVAACLGEGEVKVFAVEVAPVHGIGEKIDETRVQVVAHAMTLQNAFGSLGPQGIWVGFVRLHGHPSISS